MDIWLINNYSILTMFWNIFLLIIPFFLCCFLIKYWQKNKFTKFYQKIIALILGFFWLLFIPNSAYIITDIRHLLDYCPNTSIYRVCPENTWMIMFFFIYACIGLVGFIALLNQMKNFIDCLFNTKYSTVFIILIIPLISLGVLLGLLDRWNSWDFFTHPIMILKNILVYFTDFIYFKNFIIFTIGLYILYFMGRRILKN